MRQFEIKTIDAKAVDVDDKSRRVKIVLNRTGILDNDKDIIESNAFDKTIRERGPKGKNLIWHLTDHRASLKDAIGKFSELFMEGQDLVGVTDIPETTWGTDVLQFYKTGHINQHSIGYAIVRREIVNEDDWENRHQILKELTLYEGSAVLWGANEFTPTRSVGKSMADLIKCPKCNELTKNVEAGMGYIKCGNCEGTFTSQIISEEDKKTEFKKTTEDLANFYKLFKSGHLTDQSYELIEIKMHQLTDRLLQLFEDSTQAAQKALAPEEISVLSKLELLNNNQKTAKNGTFNSRSKNPEAV